MTALDRRTFVAATAAAVVAPTVAGAAECPHAGMDWMTMSLEARNLAYHNVAHVGPDCAGEARGVGGSFEDAARAAPKHLDLAYGPGERTKWDLYPAADPNAPCFVHIHGGYWQRGSKEIFACLAEGADGARLVGGAAGLHARPRREPDADHRPSCERRSTGWRPRPPSTASPGRSSSPAGRPAGI